MLLHRPQVVEEPVEFRKESPEVAVAEWTS